MIFVIIFENALFLINDLFIENLYVIFKQQTHLQFDESAICEDVHPVEMFQCIHKFFSVFFNKNKMIYFNIKIWNFFSQKEKEKRIESDHEVNTNER